MSTNEKQNATNASSLSKSQQKRADRQKKNEQVKREGVIGAVIGILAIALILGGVIFSIVSTTVKKANDIEPNNDYSKFITEAGLIEGVKASSIVTLPADYNSIKIPVSEIEYTDAEFEEEKKTQLENHKVMNSETDKAVENGDKIGLDYVGSVDGVEFEGGSTNGTGTTLEIGSGTYIPGFEEQIIGHKVGDVFDINVTFPEEYGNEELNGKDAVFNITVNGIYEEGEFTDEFVAENLKAYAETVDGYKQYLIEKNEKSRTQQYLENYITDNSTLSKYPEKYLNQLKAMKKYSDTSSFEYMNQMYQSMYGYGFSNFQQYSGLSPEAYEESVDESCRKEELQYIALQSIAEKEGITVTEDDIRLFCEQTYGAGSFDSTLETYGRNYLAQKALQNLVYSFLKDNAVIQ